MTRPRSWTLSSIANDTLPHLISGAVTVLTLRRMIDPRTITGH
jgi:hypothetical protein